MSEYQIINGLGQQASDQGLLYRLGDGDQEAFSLIYRRYWEELYVTAARTLRSRDGAADVVQDVFVSLWNRRCDLNITGSLVAYLHTSVRYECIHYIEKNITRRDYLSRLAETVDEHLAETITENLQLKELQHTLHEVVSQMPARMQEVYKLSRHEYLSHKEIARALNISPETVKKHIQHALEHIKASLLSHSLILTFFFCRILL